MHSSMAAETARKCNWFYCPINILVTLINHTPWMRHWVYCVVCDLTAVGNLCLEECTSFSSVLHTQSIHIPFLLSKQPFIDRNHCFTDLLLASTQAGFCAKSCFLSKHAPATISLTSETAVGLERVCGPQNQDTAALTVGEFNEADLFFFFFYLSETESAYPGPTKKFPTPTLDNQAIPPCFCCKQISRSSNMWSLQSKLKASSEGAELVLQDWKLFKEAATQGSNINFCRGCFTAYWLHCQMCWQGRDWKDKDLTQPESLQEKRSLAPHSSASKLAREMSLEQ